MNPFAPIPRACPVCGSSSKRLLYTQRFAGLSDASLLDGYEVVVCTDCGLGYADNLPPQSGFDAYYRDLSKYENQHVDGALSAYDRKRFPETLELIAGSLPDRDLRILEIGCSTGGLLQDLQAAGYTRVVGLDPSPVCTRLARERCGAVTLTGSLSDLGPETGTLRSHHPRFRAGTSDGLGSCHGQPQDIPLTSGAPLPGSPRRFAFPRARHGALPGIQPRAHHLFFTSLSEEPPRQAWFRSNLLPPGNTRNEAGRTRRRDQSSLPTDGEINGSDS